MYDFNEMIRDEAWRIRLEKCGFRTIEGTIADARETREDSSKEATVHPMERCDGATLS